MTINVKSLVTTTGWSGPREKREKDSISPPTRTIDPSNPKVGYTTTDAILFALEQMGGEGTCNEVIRFIEKYKIPIPFHAPKRTPKNNAPAKPFNRKKHERGLFTAYYGHCYLNPGWSFTDDIGFRVRPNGKGKLEQVHRINDNGRQFLRDRLDGVIPTKIATDLFDIAGIIDHQQSRPARDPSQVTAQGHRRRLRAMFTEALAKEMPVAHYEYFPVNNTMPFVLVEGSARIPLSDPRHPYNDLFEEVKLAALLERRNVFVESGNDGSSHKDAIIVRVEEIVVQKPVDNPEIPESVEISQDTNREPVAAMIGQQGQLPGLLPRPNADVYDLVVAEMSRIAPGRKGRDSFVDREQMIRGSVLIAWDRLCEFTNNRHRASRDSLLNLSIAINLPIPNDIDLPTNPYNRAIVDIIDAARTSGFRLDSTLTSRGFEVRFVRMESR